MSKSGPIFERVLLTNDDGFDAPGLDVLERVAAPLAREIWIVAPAEDQSGTSHSISLHEPLRASRRGERRFAVRGTPGDCVALAVGHLMSGARPDLILSGVNRGANLGKETVFSGTVGAAMTGMLLGIPSIALSQAFTDRHRVPWEVASMYATDTVARLAALMRGANACINVNFPSCAVEDVRPLKLTSQGVGLLNGIDVVANRDPRDIDYYWLKLRRAPQPDTDESETIALAAGHVTATPLRFERTDDAALAQLGRESG